MAAIAPALLRIVSFAMLPLALTQDGQVVYGLKRIPLGTLQQKKLMDYDDEVERQRRLLCDSVLSLLALLNPKYVQNAVKKVGRGVKDYWTGLKLRAGDDVSFASVLEWIRNAQATHGMRVESAKVQALAAAGRVRAEIVLART